jgi:AraC-like DNA-binding protein/GNAT superfamily N-acetyltransferase
MAVQSMGTPAPATAPKVQSAQDVQPSAAPKLERISKPQFEPIETAEATKAISDEATQKQIENLNALLKAKQTNVSMEYDNLSSPKRVNIIDTETGKVIRTMPPEAANEIADKAKNYILQHLNTQFILEDIAKSCGYSIYHFSREFKKATGSSIMEFTRKERIFDAREKLLSGKSIFEVALEYGFDTHTAFTNAFFRYTGCSPSGYRKHEESHNNYVKGEIKMIDSSVVIRMIEITDVNDMWENVFSRNTPEEIKERIQRDLDGYDDRTHFHVVAEVNGIVVGTLGLERFNKYSRYANLWDFVIHPDYQGKGLARKMLNKVQEVIKDTNIETLQIQTGVDREDKKNKYISLGFTEVFKSGTLIYLMMAL